MYLMAKKKITGICRICGEEKQMTEEHYIPRNAGGGIKAILYSGDELMKTLHKDENGNTHKPRGKIKQSGLSDYTLCKECNEQSGTNYDKDFGRFYNGVHYLLTSQLDIPNDSTTEEFLADKIVTMTLMDIKPCNIAKRILVSFCSIEHPVLTDRMPEIRKAIMDKDYAPDTDDFAIYLSLHVGNSAFYGTVAALMNIGGNNFVQAYAGMENELLAFYFTGDKDTKKTGLDMCVDITEWLTKYKYDEVANVQAELMFNRSKMLRFPIG